MKKRLLNWGSVSWILLGVVLIGSYGRNKWMAHELLGVWTYQTVEVNNGKLITLSPIKMELELNTSGDYIINKQKESDYRFRQRVGRLYLQLYHNGSLEAPLISTEYLVRKHGDVYTLTNNEMVLEGNPVATGSRLTKKQPIP
ncbi:hypothetical protein [uncultured Vagococcus sp.]|uniref:hypothetical protein n=1 Tax=uncultured Vagococcus sp. TaxID=189676 RepID=UPI0028D4F0D3|nr:hypothetical protein [uncultured Vagococcus sp.]